MYESAGPSARQKGHTHSTAHDQYIGDNNISIKYQGNICELRNLRICQEQALQKSSTCGVPEHFCSETSRDEKYY